jgi:hypothetical protein
MAFNISKVSSTFKRKVTLYIANDKGTDDVVHINCCFIRKTKDEAEAIQDAIDDTNVSKEKEAIINATLDEVWTSWDVVDDNGPKPFNRESREELFNLLPGTMVEVLMTWIKGCSGRDRKNV